VTKLQAGTANNNVDIQCGGSLKATGGGVQSSDDGAKVLKSHPLESPSAQGAPEDGETPTGWRGRMDGGTTITTYVICVP
jgi:hypothetical protein